MTRFEGYGVLVTGAGQGIGEAVARRFAAEGAGVLVTGRDGGRAERAATAIRAAGATARALACDVTDAEAVRAAVAHAADAFGGLHVLVNNAYAVHRDPPRFEDWREPDWYEDFEVTLHGAARCARAALPLLAGAPGRAAIVNIGSVNAERHAAWITGVSLPVDGGLLASHLAMSRGMAGEGA